jgi:hypothetical protein
LEVAARYFRAGADKVRAKCWIALHVEEYIEFTLRFYFLSRR